MLRVYCSLYRKRSQFFERGGGRRRLLLPFTFAVLYFSHCLLAIFIMSLCCADKDVLRTDRDYRSYSSLTSPKLQQMENILRTYTMYNFDLGKCNLDVLFCKGRHWFVKTTTTTTTTKQNYSFFCERNSSSHVAIKLMCHQRVRWSVLC